MKAERKDLKHLFLFSQADFWRQQGKKPGYRSIIPIFKSFSNRFFQIKIGEEKKEGGKRMAPESPPKGKGGNFDKWMPCSIE